jgi:hypothetical protein
MTTTMKLKAKTLTILAAVALAVTGAIISSLGQQWTISVVKTVTTNTVPEQLTTTEYWGHTVTFLGMKATRTNNTGTVYVQWNSTNQGSGIPLLPGAVLSITMPDEKKKGICATNFYIDVETDGDGVVAFIMD